MYFKEILNLIYIDRGFFSNQAGFLRELLEHSVEKPEKISFAESTLKGYYIGNGLTELAPILMDAKLREDKISAHIKSLYETKFKTVKTKKVEFIGKTYKEALHAKAVTHFKDVTMENMADIIAHEFYDIIVNIAKTVSVEQKTDAEDEHSRIVNLYKITDDDKTAIKNICGIINTGLHELNDIAHTLYVLFSIIHNNNNKDHEWRIGLWRRVNKNQELYNEKYNELQQHCAAVVNILKPKCVLNTSIKCICDIAEDFCNNKYFFTKDDFAYSALETVQTEFENNSQLLLAYLDSI